MGAELGALVRVHAALEEGAEDRGVDGAPVEAGGLVEAVELVAGELEGAVGGEEVAVEAVDHVRAEGAPLVHGREELAGEAREELRLPAALLEDAGEDAFGQEADVLGEEGEDEAVEEVGDLAGVEAALAQRDGDLAHGAGGVGGDRLADRAGLELLRGDEDRADDLEVPGVAELLEADLVDLLPGGGEVGVDHQAVHVAGDEERRVLEVGAVLVELEVGGVEVLVLALVLPGEVAALPDVGPAVRAVLLRSALLEGEEVAGGVDPGAIYWIALRAWGVVEEIAEVEEVLLGGGALGELDPAPLVDELGDVHGLTTRPPAEALPGSGRARDRFRLPEASGESAPPPKEDLSSSPGPERRWCR